MESLHSRSNFLFCASLTFVLLFGSTLVHGRRGGYPVKKRQVPDYTSSNYGRYPSNYPSPNSNNPSSGNHLYPTLDFDGVLDPYFSPYQIRGRNGTRLPTSNVPNWNVVGPKFNPYPNNGYNVTHHPNFNFSNGWNGHPNSYPDRNNNQSFGWNNHNQQRDPHFKPFPNNNFPNSNVHNQPPVNVVPRTTCGKTLCSYVPSYPTTEINDAVARARDTLKAYSGMPNSSKRYTGISGILNSKVHSPWIDNNKAGNYGVVGVSLCKTKANSIYPHEGFSSDDRISYYVVNVPNLSQAVPNVECDGSEGQSCSQRATSLSASSSCQQTYRKLSLLAVPIGKRYYDIDDFQLRMFDVPAGCSCMPRRGY